MKNLELIQKRNDQIIFRTKKKKINELQKEINFLVKKDEMG